MNDIDLKYAILFSCKNKHKYPGEIADELNESFDRVLKLSVELLNEKKITIYNDIDK